jgi:hypothetical protein
MVGISKPKIEDLLSMDGIRYCVCSFLSLQDLRKRIILVNKALCDIVIRADTTTGIESVSMKINQFLHLAIERIAVLCRRLKCLELQYERSNEGEYGVYLSRFCVREYSGLVSMTLHCICVDDFFVSEDRLPHLKRIRLANCRVWDFRVYAANLEVLTMETCNVVNTASVFFSIAVCRFLRDITLQLNVPRFSTLDIPLCIPHVRKLICIVSTNANVGREVLPMCQQHEVQNILEPYEDDLDEHTRITYRRCLHYYKQWNYKS